MRLARGFAHRAGEIGARRAATPEPQETREFTRHKAALPLSESPPVSISCSMDITRLLPARFSRLARRGPRVPVIRLDGVIGASARPGATGLSDASLAPLIERAFKKNPTAVALVINSPGGSPVQSSLIAARIRRLAEETGSAVHLAGGTIAWSSAGGRLTLAD